MDGFTGREGPHLCPASVRCQEPDRGSHSRIVLSSLPDARTLPSAENAKHSTQLLQNRSSISTHFADFTSTKTLSGTSDRSAITEGGFTSPQGTYRWPLSLCLQEPVTGSQTRIVLSTLPDARTLPLAEKAKAQTSCLQIDQTFSTHFTGTKTFAGTGDLSHDHQGRVYWPSRHLPMAIKLVLARAGDWVPDPDRVVGSPAAGRQKLSVDRKDQTLYSSPAKSLKT